MKRVETIHINGIVFSIEDDAYDRLSVYIDALGKYFENEQGGGEIIADIEARIAELFTGRQSGREQAVTLADVVRVIETLGAPEDIAGIDVEPDMKDPFPTDRSQIPPKQKTKFPAKRLYRDIDRRIAGGVCAGLAVWFDIKPAWMRLIFVLAVFLLMLLWQEVWPFVIYILLWIIIPKAKTTSQKLEMQGKPVTITNIEENIKNSQQADRSLVGLFRQFITEAGEFFGKVFQVIWNIAVVIFGIYLCCLGIFVSIATGCLFFVPNVVFRHDIEWDFLSFNDLFHHLVSPASYYIVWICAAVVVCLLVAACLFWGLKLIFKFKARYKTAHITFAIVWILAVFTGIITCLYESRNYAWDNHISETQTVTIPADTLYLSVTPGLRLSNNPMDVYFDKSGNRFYGKPDLRIRKSKDGQIKTDMRKHSQGESKIAAYQYAENIEYAISQKDSLLTFAPHFTVTPQDTWKFQTLAIDLYIPEGTVIVVDKGMYSDRLFQRWFWRRYNSDYTWIMTESDGLRALDWKK
jgi:phage shock protein PspC (stress-responsive transcriptional regulator)